MKAKKTPQLRHMHTLKRKCLIIFLICILPLLASLSIHAQDLIERTQLGIPNVEQDQDPNALARKVASAMSHARSHEEISLFSLAKNGKATARSIEGSAVILQIDQTSIDQLVKNPKKSFSMTIPVDERSSVRLNLVRNKLFADGFEVTTSAAGNAGQRALGIFYHGTVEGDPTSIVALSVFEDRVDIFLDDGRGYYQITQQKNNEYLFYNARTTGDFGKWKCHNNARHSTFKEVRVQPTNSHGRSAMMGCVPVYVEADFSMFQREGANTTPYITSMMNQTVTIYASIGITIEMSELFVHTTADPWAGQELGAKLDNFGLVKGNAYNGRLAHLITAEDGGGVAWTDVLCAMQSGTDPSGPFGVSGATTATTPSTDDVITLAHELGHNFGSDHTQACVWNGNNTAIDGCVQPENGPNGETCDRPEPNCPAGGGTIMSYCNTPDPPLTTCTVNTTWHPQVQTLIINNWNTATQNCLNTACGGGGTPMGYTCADPFIINAAGTFMAPGPSQGNGAVDQMIATHANWYRFTPPMTGMIRIFTCGLANGGNNHNHIYLDATNCPTNTNNVMHTADRGCAADPDDPALGVLLENVPVTMGVPIYIEWDDAGGNTAAFTWTLEYMGGGAPCAVPTYAMDCSTDHINSFTFGAYSNQNTGCAAGLPNNLTDYKPQGPTVQAGQTYAVTCAAGTENQYYAVYIDFNNNGSFLDAGEFFNIGQAQANGNVMANVTIPANATAGTFSMRVRSAYNNGDTPLTQADGCQTQLDWGEIEEYNIVIQGDGNCPPTLAKNEMNIASGIYQASIQLTSSGTIGAGNNVTFRAGNNVELQNNFTAPLTSILEVKIEGCQ